jgi:beta-glucosidase
MKTHHALRTIVAATSLFLSLAAGAQEGKPWMNRALDPDQRAQLVVAQMTREEKQTLVFGFFASDAPWKKYSPAAEARAGSAGYVPGIARLGIPPQWLTDAGIGVASQGGAKEKPGRTALPSGLATAASFDPEAARRAGAMIGAEARASGFNVMLAGGVNLVREPRNGRNFEYGGEDPLLAGVIVGAQIAGIESNHIISTVKHYALNDQETNRNTLNVSIDRDQAHMSDLLAFKIAMEQSNAGAVMCSYNKVWGEHACDSAYLLTEVLRRDWGWQGYVMSDWGATHSTAKAANAGLDQQSGYPFDDKPYFGELLLKAVDSGELGEARLTQMAQRIVRTMFAKGVVDDPVTIGPIDFKAHAEISRAAAEGSAVLLKNAGDVLPLKSSIARIAVIGGHADKGVLAGGGSSLVYPAGGNAVPGIEPTSWPGPVLFYPSSPLRAIQNLAPGAQVQFASGTDRAAAAHLAAGSDVALVFVTHWDGEAFDKPLTLEGEQDALVQAVVSANPRTVVVLETGGAVFMPWIDKVPACLAGVVSGVQRW